MKKIFLLFVMLWGVMSGYAQTKVTFKITLTETATYGAVMLNTPDFDQIVGEVDYGVTELESSVILNKNESTKVILFDDLDSNSEINVSASGVGLIELQTEIDPVEGKYYYFEYTPTSRPGVINIEFTRTISTVNIVKKNNALGSVFVTRGNNSVSIPEGTTYHEFSLGQILKVTPSDLDDYICSVSVNGNTIASKSTSPVTYNIVPKDNIDIIFDLATFYEIFAYSNTVGGSVSVEANRVMQGNNARFFFSPNDGYRVSSAMLNGVDRKDLIVNNVLEYSISGTTILNVTWEYIPQPYVNGNLSPNNHSISNLSEIVLNGAWTSSNFVALGAVLNGSSNLTRLVFGSDFESANGADINGAFSNCKNLKTITSELSSDMSMSLSMSGAFYGCSSLESASFDYLSGIYEMSNTFGGCTSLTSVILEKVPSVGYSTFNNANTNCLVYLKGGSSSYPSGWNNSVLLIHNSATLYSYTLDANQPFNCPTAFRANHRISYVRSFLPATAAGAGWETITLPFAPQSIRGVIGGDGSGIQSGDSRETEIQFFNKGQQSGAHFWIREYTGFNSGTFELGFDDANNFYANTPYNIALPGGSFGDGNRLDARPITFSATSTLIPATTDLSVSINGASYVGTLAPQTMSSNQYTLSSTGTSFINAGTRTSNPFRGYIETASASAVALKIVAGSNIGTGLELVKDDLVGSRDIAKVYATKGAIMVEATKAGTLLIHTINGTLVNQVEVTEGTNRVSVAAGTYLVNGNKVIVY